MSSFYKNLENRAESVSAKAEATKASARVAFEVASPAERVVLSPLDRDRETVARIRAEASVASRYPSF